MYTVSSYGEMIADPLRMNAYVSAMRGAIKAGSVVLDLGSGPGLFAMLACQMGARRVYAIEPSDVIQVGREAAAANGFADRIEFFHNFSTRVTLPEPADVIVSDLRGPLPLHQQHIPSIRDARERLLAKDGVLIPERDSLWAAIVDAPEQYRELVGPWEQTDYGIDLTAARSLVTNSWIRTRLKPEHLLVDPVCFHTLNYYEVEDADFAAEISFRVNKSGMARGLGAWFDSELFEGITFSNNPGADQLIYGNGLFFFPYPVEVSTGDRIEVKFMAHLPKTEYIWSWNTRIFDQGDEERCKADFKQSTFLGSPFSLDQLKKRAASHMPNLNQSGQIQEFVLSHMNGSTSLEEIARELVSRFPNWFHDSNVALAQVAQLSTEYSQ
jgi:PRMT5 arginine-N-methyltransferase/ribosomal protein L11 methyltransferase PrmA